MDSFDIGCEGTLNLYPDWKLLEYLTWASDILNCEQNWNIDTLCFKMEQIDLDLDQQDDTVANSNVNSIILDSTEVKNIFLSDNEVKRNLEMFVKVLLRFISNKIENFEKSDYKLLLIRVTKICCFVNACEESNIIIIPLKTHVTKFLSNLFHILGAADKFNFTVKGPVYQPIVNIILSFKKITFVRSFIIAEISKRLKSFCNVMAKTPTNNFDMGSYEILLLYLMILKEILEYNVQKWLLTPTITVNKKEDIVLMDISQKLTNILDKLPDYVAFTVQNCLNLLG